MNGFFYNRIFETFLPGREKVMWELLWLALSGLALI